jgi:hypothetical protein
MLLKVMDAAVEVAACLFQVASSVMSRSTPPPSAPTTSTAAIPPELAQNTTQAVRVVCVRGPGPCGEDAWALNDCNGDP